MYTQDALSPCSPLELDTSLVCLVLLARLHNVTASSEQFAHEYAEDGRLLLSCVGRVAAAGFSMAGQLLADSRWGAFDRMGNPTLTEALCVADLNSGVFFDAGFGIGHNLTGMVKCCTQFSRPLRLTINKLLQCNCGD